jgi:hypothetical protein
MLSGRISKALCQAAQQNHPHQSPGLHTHLLDLDSDFLNLLRLSARITKTNKQDALALRDLVDKALEEFRQSMGRI